MTMRTDRPISRRAAVLWTSLPVALLPVPYLLGSGSWDRFADKLLSASPTWVVLAGLLYALFAYSIFVLFRRPTTKNRACMLLCGLAGANYPGLIVAGIIHVLIQGGVR